MILSAMAVKKQKVFLKDAATCKRSLKSSSITPAQQHSRLSIQPAPTETQLDTINKYISSVDNTLQLSV